MVSLYKWAQSMDVSTVSVYMYVNLYADELKRLGCIKVRKTAKSHRIYILNEDCVLDFLEQKGIFLKERAHV